MVADAEVLKIACEVLQDLEIGEFTIKVRGDHHILTALSLSDFDIRLTFFVFWSSAIRSITASY